MFRVIYSLHPKKQDLPLSLNLHPPTPIDIPTINIFMSIVHTQAEEIKIKTIQIVSKSHKNNDRNVVKVSLFVSLLYVRIENCMLDCYFCALTQLVFSFSISMSYIAKHTPLFPRLKFIFILCVVNTHSFCRTMNQKPVKRERKKIKAAVNIEEKMKICLCLISFHSFFYYDSFAVFLYI